MEETNLIFVYGTLRKGFDNPTAKYLHSTQKFLGEGHFPGVLFKISYFPGAVYQPGANTKVFGQIFQINKNRDLLLSKLDQYEGFDPHFEQPNEFIRKILPVQHQGRTLHAYTYLYNLPYSNYQIIENGKFH